MSLLEYVKGKGFVNPEYVTTLNKDCLLILNYANDPTNIKPQKKLSYAHNAAIKKAYIVSTDPLKYADLKIDIQKLEDHTLSLMDFINNLNYHLQKIKSDGLVYDDAQKNLCMMTALKKDFPNLMEDSLIEGYELSEYLETLKRGVIYEGICLDDLLKRYREVPENIKKEFNVGPL